MGLAYPRTSVAMLADSGDSDRGFNSSALSIADSLGAALALSLCGIGFTAASAAGRDPFLAVFGVGILCAVGAVVTSSRTPCLPAATATRGTSINPPPGA